MHDRVAILHTNISSIYKTHSETDFVFWSRMEYNNINKLSSFQEPIEIPVGPNTREGNCQHVRIPFDLKENKFFFSERDSSIHNIYSTSHKEPNSKTLIVKYEEYFKTIS